MIRPDIFPTPIAPSCPYKVRGDVPDEEKKELQGVLDKLWKEYAWPAIFRSIIYGEKP